MENKPPSQFRYTRRYGIAVAIAIVISFYFLNPRDTDVVELSHGPFKQMLQTPGAYVSNLRVERSSIRGEVGYPNQAASDDSKKPMVFRVIRQGVENDETLSPLLDKYAPNFEAEGEKSDIAVMNAVPSAWIARAESCGPTAIAC